MSRFKVPFIGLTVLSLVSCSSEEIRTEPNPFAPTPKTVTLQFKLGDKTYTRADGEGNEVESLRLAFFHSNNGGSPLFLQSVVATKTADYYSVDIEVIPNKEPDLVVAFVNIEEVEANDAFKGTPSSTTEIVTQSGNLKMSTPTYFNAQEERIYYQSFDYTSSNTINLEVERLAAKVEVDNNITDDIISTLHDAQGDPIELKLNLTGWGITGSDKETFILSQTGTYSEMNSELTGWSNWNESSNRILNWTYSYAYNKDFSNNEKHSFLNFISQSEATNEYGGYAYVHESTRPLNDEVKYNDKPSIVLTGFYTVGDASEGATFYRHKNSIFSENDLWDFFLKKISGKVTLNGENLNKEYLKNNFSLAHTPRLGQKALPSSYITLVPNENIISNLENKSGEKIGTEEELSSILEECSCWAEMYKDGKCILSVPIEHNKIGGKTFYGVVRNHFYKINLNGISGMARGVADESFEIEDEVIFDEGDDNYQIKFTIRIREWKEIEQDVVIER